MLTWPPKDPNEVLDYEIDWGENRLVEGETISTSVFTVVEGTVEIDIEPAPADGIAKVWLSGGTAGETCVLLNRITTNANRTYDQSVRLRIRSK
jgi:hypothetical protein